MGTSRLSLRNPKNRKKYSVEFMVVKEDRTPLIGLKAAEQMGLVKVNNDNLDRVFTVIQPPKDLFPEVFSNDLGLLPGQVHLKTKEDVHPVVMPDRRTPLALRTELQEELKRLEPSVL